MSVVTALVQLAGPAIPWSNPSGVKCRAAVFRVDYSRCANRAVKERAGWKLCAPHARLDELEIVQQG